jgi:spore germination protein KA
METSTNQILSGNLTQDIQQLKVIFDRVFDVVYREFEISGFKKGVLVFIDELVNTESVNSDVLRPLMNYGKNSPQAKNIQIDEIQIFLQNQVITTSNIKLGMNIQDVIEDILLGNTILLIYGSQQAIFIGLRKLEKRNIEEPSVEPVVRGPRDGFTEDLRINMSLK